MTDAFHQEEARVSACGLVQALGGFPTRQEHSGVGGGPIKTLGVSVKLTAIERQQRILELVLTGAERVAAEPAKIADDSP